MPSFDLRETDFTLLSELSHYRRRSPVSGLRRKFIPNLAVADGPAGVESKLTSATPAACFPPCWFIFSAFRDLSSPHRLHLSLRTSVLFLALMLELKGAAAGNHPVEPPARSSDIAEWVEPNFPFFSSVLDARDAGSEFSRDNLTPRGLVLNLGRDCWVCFDEDLLRVAAIWRGKGVTARALAPGSYHQHNRKTPGGQTDLPKPDGQMWLANGIYPGWQVGGDFVLSDPREPAPSPEEVGRGPLPTELGRFNAIRLKNKDAELEYEVGGVVVNESLAVIGSDSEPVIERRFRISPASKPLHLIVGNKAAAAAIALAEWDPSNFPLKLEEKNLLWSVTIPKHPRVLDFSVRITIGATVPALPALSPKAEPEVALARWTSEVVTAVQRSTEHAAYVIDDIALPHSNPWRRDVRPGDIQFLRDGTGVLVTIDGDVWTARGFDDPSGRVHWRRFASGLHEPITLAIRDEQIYVFDKNGIWRLRDTNHDGEADVYELFANCFAQTADMREFPSTIRLAPGGDFIIAKGGQQATTLGKHNGSVLRVSADGKHATVLGYGFRQPNIGVNLRTGLITASDQQGQYIPSTPLHVVQGHQFYGFLAPFLPEEKYPESPAEPLTWIPHPVNMSALSQVWLFHAQMGPLNDSLVHIGFNRPELFRVLLNERTPRLQAVVMSITRSFDFTPLNGSVNPADGSLYLAGFQVIGWGNVNDSVAGLGRVRYTGAPVTLPREVVAMDQGVLLKFDVALDRQRATNPASYSLQSWSYRRTHNYGSAQYKADGSTGQDPLPVSSAYLSADGKNVFLGVPGIKPVMQLRIGWSLATKDGLAFEENAYTTPYELAKFEPAREGFGNVSVDLTPPSAPIGPVVSGPVSIEEGRRLAELFACVACHANQTGAEFAKSGPTWKGLYGSRRKVYVDGEAEEITADEAYLRESIITPSAKIAAGFEKGEFAMPSFAGVLNDAQVNSLVLFIESLR